MLPFCLKGKPWKRLIFWKDFWFCQTQSVQLSPKSCALNRPLNTIQQSPFAFCQALRCCTHILQVISSWDIRRYLCGLCDLWLRPVRKNSWGQRKLCITQCQRQDPISWACSALSGVTTNKNKTVWRRQIWIVCRPQLINDFHVLITIIMEMKQLEHVSLQKLGYGEGDFSALASHPSLIGISISACACTSATLESILCLEKLDTIIIEDAGPRGLNPLIPTSREVCVCDSSNTSVSIVAFERALCSLKLFTWVASLKSKLHLKVDPSRQNNHCAVHALLLLCFIVSSQFASCSYVLPRLNLRHV